MSARELRVTGGRTEATKNDVACICAMINFTTGFEIKLAHRHVTAMSNYHNNSMSICSLEFWPVNFTSSDHN